MMKHGQIALRITYIMSVHFHEILQFRKTARNGAFRLIFHPEATVCEFTKVHTLRGVALR
jgi:hypothetical protein